MVDSGSVSLPFAYDAAGNLKEKTISYRGSADGHFQYTHDAWNRLVKVEYVSSGGTPVDRAAYQYNGLHQRTIKLADTSNVPDSVLDQRRIMFYSASWQLLEERIEDAFVEGTSSPTSANRHMLYVWGARGMDDIAYRMENRNFADDGNGVGLDGFANGITYDNIWYHLTDSQFSTVAVLSASGKLVERISYSAYGEARHHPPADLNGDGAVDSTELSTILTEGARPGTSITSNAYEVDADIDRSGNITYANYDLANAAGTTPAIAAGLLTVPKDNHWSTSLTAGTDNIIGYCGYVFNAECMLYTVRFRHYDPALGRWLERDPLGYPDGMNAFEYVRGNCIRGIDSFGAVDGSFWGGLKELWGMITGSAKEEDKEWEGMMRENADLLKKKVDQSQHMSDDDKKRMKRSIDTNIDDAMQELEMIRAEEVVEILQTARAIVEVIAGAATGGIGFLIIGGSEVAYFAATGDYREAAIGVVMLGVGALARPIASILGRGLRFAGGQLEQMGAALFRSGRGVKPGLGTRFLRFFYDNRTWNAISKQFWRSRGGSNGLSLEHWLIRQYWANQYPLFRGIVNAGWNSRLVISKDLNIYLGHTRWARWLERGIIDLLPKT